MIVFRLVFLPVALAFDFELFGSVLKNLSVSRDVHCRADSLKIINGLNNGSIWAVRSKLTLKFFPF